VSLGCSGGGGGGTNQNYIGLNNRIFLCVIRFVPRQSTRTHDTTQLSLPRSPGALNSLAGIVSTLVKVYSAQHWEFVTTSEATNIVTAVAEG